MKKSKKIFIIGKRPTKLKLIITAIVAFILSLMLSNFFMVILKLEGSRIFITAIIFVLLSLLYIPTVAICTEHWDISEQYLEHYYITNYFQQLKYAINVFKNKEDIFASKIQLDQIKSIRLYWTTKLYVYSTIAHPIYFGITLKDGSIITFESLLTACNQEYIDAIKYLQDKYNIQIEDKYDLLTVLEDPKRNLVTHIDEIQKQSKRGEVRCKG